MGLHKKKIRALLRRASPRTSRLICIASCVLFFQELSASERVGLSGPVNALQARGDSLYVGGFFPRAGGVRAPSVALRRGGRWHALGPGLLGVVHALAAPAGTRNVYAGGAFILAGGMPLKNIARWDGRRWRRLGRGTDGPVRALLMHKGRLYAAGHFTRAGRAFASSVAVWNGRRWAPLGKGIPGRVYSLAWHQGRLFAAGRFHTEDGRRLRNIAVWDGRSWTSPGKGYADEGRYSGTRPRRIARVYSLVVHRGLLYAGGIRYDWRARSLAPSVLVWKKGVWSDVGEILGGVRVLYADGKELYAGGRFRLHTAGRSYLRRRRYGFARWDGENWDVAGGRLRERGVQALVKYQSHLYLGGRFRRFRRSRLNYLARMEPGGPAPILDLHGLRGVYGDVNVLRRRGDRIYVAGNFIAPAIGKRTGAAAWNLRKKAWETLGNGLGEGIVRSLVVVSPEKIYASGLFRIRMKNGSMRRAEQAFLWNGTTWRRLGPFYSESRITRVEVNALAVYRGVLYAGGRFPDPDGQGFYHLARYKNGVWERAGPRLNSVVTSLVAGENGLYAGGRFTRAGLDNLYGIAFFDGKRFFPLGEGRDNGLRREGGRYGRTNAEAKVLFFRGNKLYVAGDFSRAGGISVPGFAVWNKKRWSLPPGGRRGFRGGEVRSLSFQGNRLFIAGRRLYLGGGRRSQAGLWDGRRWRSFRAGERGCPLTGATDSGRYIYISCWGRFTHRDSSVDVRGIARLDPARGDLAGLRGRVFFRSRGRPGRNVRRRPARNRRPPRTIPPVRRKRPGGKEQIIRR